MHPNVTINAFTIIKATRELAFAMRLNFCSQYVFELLLNLSGPVPWSPQFCVGFSGFRSGFASSCGPCSPSSPGCGSPAHGAGSFRCGCSPLLTWFCSRRVLTWIRVWSLLLAGAALGLHSKGEQGTAAHGVLHAAEPLSCVGMLEFRPWVC